MAQRYSIDFGTTNSVVAGWHDGKGETVALPGLTTRVGEHSLIPSLLYVRDGRAGDVLTGAQVRAGGFDQQPGDRLFRNFKRGIGVSARHEPRIIDGVPWNDTDAGEHFLRRLLLALPCPPADIEQLVITVPVTTFDGYSAWLKTALAGFPSERIRIVDESTAAALGYAVSAPGATALISDFGGGTLDLSLVRLPQAGSRAGSTLDRLLDGERGGSAQVIAKAGLSLGGSDIDRWLLEEILQRAHLSTPDLGPYAAAWLSACENAKIALSNAQSAEIVLPPPNPEKHAFTLTRAALESLLERHGFYAALRETLDKLMGQAHQRGVYREDIGDVLLVGGTSLIPSVQRDFDTYFRAVTHGRRKISLPVWPALHWTVENTTIRVDRPFTAVVEGALQISAGLGLEDRLTHSYGLRVAGPAAGQTWYEEIIPAGSPYPTAPVSVMLAAAIPGQAAVDFVVGQIEPGEVPGSSGGEVSALDPGYQTGQTQRIIPLNAAEPLRVHLDPPGVVGKARLSAAFSVDGRRQLLLTVTDLRTRHRLIQQAIALDAASPTAPQASLESASQAAYACSPALASPISAGGSRLSLRNLGSALNLLPASHASVEVLAASLRSADPLVRFQAAELLSRRADREARLALEDILARGTPPQRAASAQHLYHFSWFTARGLFERALADPDGRVHEAALFALCKMRAPEAGRLAVAALRSPDATDGMRRAAISGATGHPDAGSVPVLEQALATVNREIREEALEVLGATGAAQAIPLVRRALDDPDPDIKYAATLSWLELAGDSCLPELADLLESARCEARRAILRGFFHATNYTGLNLFLSPHVDTLLSALEMSLADELPQTRIAAALPLAWIRHPRAAELLLGAFRAEPDADARAHMLSNAVNLSSPAAGALLDASVSDPMLLVRQTGEYLRSTARVRHT